MWHFFELSAWYSRVYNTDTYIESNTMKPVLSPTLTLTSRSLPPPSFGVKPPYDRAQSHSSAEKLIWVPLWSVSITTAGTIATSLKISHGSRQRLLLLVSRVEEVVLHWSGKSCMQSSMHNFQLSIINNLFLWFTNDYWSDGCLVCRLHGLFFSLPPRCI